jgi:hypothetical protein
MRTLNGRGLLALTLATAVAAWALLSIRKRALADDDAVGAIAGRRHDAERRARVLATFRNGRITVGEMEDAIANKLPATRARYVDEAGRRSFLSDLIGYELLALEAGRLGYATHPSVVEETQHVMIDKTVGLELPLDPAAVPDDEVAADYAERVRQFDRPAQRRASQIVVPTQAEARALFAKLSRHAERFASIARERSRDALSRARGGDLGFFDREGKQGPDGRVVPRAVVDAVFSLSREGEITRRPIRVEGGFSIAMFTGENPGLHATLAKLEGGIRDRRASERQQHDLDEWVAKLRAEVKPEVHPELVDAIALDPAPAGDIPSGFPAAPPDPWAPPILVEPDGI